MVSTQPSLPRDAKPNNTDACRVFWLHSFLKITFQSINKMGVVFVMQSTLILVLIYICIKLKVCSIEKLLK